MTDRTEAQIAALGSVDSRVAERIVENARRDWAAAAPAPRPPRRLPGAPTRMRLALGGVVALALAGALVFAFRPWSGGQASASLLRRVSIAVTPPPHTVQHIVTVLHQGSLVLTTESWQSMDDQFTLRWRQTMGTKCGDWTTEMSSTIDQRQWFDSDHGRVLRIPLIPAKERAALPADGARVQFDPTVSFAAALKRGEAHVAGSTSLHGVPVTQIDWPSQDPNDPASRNVIFVATATGVPVAYRWGGGKLDATGGVVAQQTFPTYEFLPDNANTRRALSESASHPSAAMPPVTTEKELSAASQEAQRKHCGGVG
jgi:hypothetical protein